MRCSLVRSRVHLLYLSPSPSETQPYRSAVKSAYYGPCSHFFVGVVVAVVITTGGEEEVT